jgi:hypothetical protein
MTWQYQGKEILSIEDLPENIFGFIYQVTHLPTGRKYVGKKQLMSSRTLPPLKGEKRKRKVVKESDWKTYYGSHPEIKALVKESKEDFHREILQFVPSKKLLTYMENKYLFSLGVIEPGSNYINDNIEGRYFKKDFL